MKYYEIRMELQEINREDDGTFINAVDLGVGEPILAESSDKKTIYNILQKIKDAVK